MHFIFYVYNYKQQSNLSKANSGFNVFGDLCYFYLKLLDFHAADHCPQ